MVVRIFQEFLDGVGLHAIARGLTDDGIPCPSAADPARNRHRLAKGPAWTYSSVRAILDNPRYTGYQVWNKQRRDEELIDVTDVALGHHTKMRWNDQSQWIWSDHPSHQPLITSEQWEAVQAKYRRNQRAFARVAKEGHTYMLAGRLTCGQCGRLMTGTWNHDRPYYRCQAQRYLPTTDRDHPTRMYVREDKIVPHLDTWMAKLFNDENIDDTCELLAEAAQPDDDREAQRRHIKDRIRQLDEELDKYRAVIQAEPEASPVVGKWIAETHQERRRLETLLGATPTSTVTPEDIKALVASLRDITATLATADPKDKAEVYAEMGLELTYHNDGQLVVEATPRRLRSSVGERT